jgi:T-complex protein 1 subunit beta
MASFNPTQIFDDGTTEEKGENARLSAFVGAIAVGDLGKPNCLRQVEPRANDST